jgi:N4-gp56 family major capsid protein
VPTIQTSTTNFDKTIVALVLSQIAENLRKRTHWLDEGAYIKGSLNPGHDTIRYIGYSDLSSATQGLTEGNTAATLALEEALAIRWEEFTASQYGRLVGITDIALGRNPHDLASVAAERVAQNASLTLDRAIGDTIEAYTTAPAEIRPAGRAARVNVTQNSSDYLTAALVRQAVTRLRAANVPTFPDGYYHGIVHPFVAADLMSESAATAGAWVDVRRYGGTDGEDILRGEVGRVHGCRFMESNLSTYLGPNGATSAHIFGTVIYGPEYYAFGDEQSIEAHVVRPGGDHADPLAQKMLVGWKGMWGAKVVGMTDVGPRFRNVISVSSFAEAG